MTATGVEEMFGEFPVVVSVVEKINEPRYPSFKGIMAAKKKTIETINVASLGISIDSPWSIVVDSSLRPARSAGVIISDDGTSGDQLVAFLVEKKLI